ncbi:hypothetical protein BV25DRAFT_6149 [Artomyces pyxidatus]|uniref:Uncharacterized protein n=1 Tax=Artomyces pyxidatus TaxID=48021 RepID=A0ACB8TJ91_9AGAM|nr:hypothetical protein BV25DRAFT_6149 [Artomyces pyxidatus]
MRRCSYRGVPRPLLWVLPPAHSMTSLALGAAYASVQLVYQAYSKVKTNRTRCARLVDRCDLVVERLQRVVAATGDDTVVQERIHELERAFEYTACTIAEVGQQGLVASLLQAGADALRIDACNDVLTELVALFTLEGVVDVRRGQRELQDEHAALAREVALQGARLGEVHQLVQDISAALGGVGFGAAAAFSGDAVCDPTACVSLTSTALKPHRAATMRRLSSALSTSSTARVSGTPRSRKRRYSVGDTDAEPAAQRKLKGSGEAVAACDAPMLWTAQRTPDSGSPVDPPPPYRMYVANPSSDDGRSVLSEPGFAMLADCAVASVEAVRALDSPVPSLPSPRWSTDCVFASTEDVRWRASDEVPPQVKRTNSTTTTPTLRRRGTIAYARRNTVASV